MSALRPGSRVKKRPWRQVLCAIAGVGILLSACEQRASDSFARTSGSNAALRSFEARGVIRQLRPDADIVVIQHEAISNYMDAMTMPFNVRSGAELKGLQEGDVVSFRLQVSERQSWIDRITRSGESSGDAGRNSNRPPATTAAPARSRHPLLDYQFTNELGEAVSLGEFRGQALAITFFFTRCPIPDFCPRLSRNFEEAAQQLKSMPGAPTNWHLLSVSFDPAVDTPAVMKAYGERYHYDPKHWSFLTGPADKITELARLSDVNIERQGEFFNHNFRTLIIDACGKLQMSFPIGGNLSEAIVRELTKAAATTNGPAER